MPGNPKECRENALRCANLAHKARTTELKQLMIELSRNWMKMAAECERANTLLADYPPESEKRA